uniref:Uncharacterized protein n=1 Tax=Romanomermis culicivorax TaxID=13658 RepID=A0A915IE75_ROMCU
PSDLFLLSIEISTSFELVALAVEESEASSASDSKPAENINFDVDADAGGSFSSFSSNIAPVFPTMAETDFEARLRDFGKKQRFSAENAKNFRRFAPIQ